MSFNLPPPAKAGVGRRKWGTRDFKRRGGAPRGELADRKAGARFAKRELYEIAPLRRSAPSLGAKTRSALLWGAIEREYRKPPAGNRSRDRQRFGSLRTWLFDNLIGIGRTAGARRHLFFVHWLGLTQRPGHDERESGAVGCGKKESARQGRRALPDPDHARGSWFGSWPIGRDRPGRLFRTS